MVKDELLEEPQVREVLKLGHTKYNQLIQTGQLASVSIGRRRLVRASDLAAFIKGLAIAQKYSKKT